MLGLAVSGFLVFLGLNGGLDSQLLGRSATLLVLEGDS